MEKNCFQHFLITRFNLKKENFSSRLNATPEIRLNSNWLNYRFKLFDYWCYPSIQQQSNQNFKWIVLFDKDTPDEFKDKISLCNHTYRNFIPVYHSSKKPLFQEVIGCHLNSNAKYLITTRMDNDDAIDKSFVQRIQDEFNFQKDEFINFPNGYVLSEDNKLFSKKAYSNHFISRISAIEESIEEFKQAGNNLTVMVGDHRYLENEFSVRNIEAKPVWLEVNHGGNVSGRGIKRGRYKRQPLSKLSEGFPIDIGEAQMHENLLQLRIEQIFNLTNRSLSRFKRLGPTS